MSGTDREFGTDLLETRVRRDTDGSWWWERTPGRRCPDEFRPFRAGAQGGLLVSATAGRTRRYRVGAPWSVADVLAAGGTPPGGLAAVFERIGEVLGEVHASPVPTTGSVTHRGYDRLREFLDQRATHGWRPGEHGLAGRHGEILHRIDILAGSRVGTSAHGNPTLGGLVLDPEGRYGLLAGEDYCLAAPESDLGVLLGDLVEFAVAGLPGVGTGVVAHCAATLLDACGSVDRPDRVPGAVGLRLLWHLADYQRFSARPHDPAYARVMVATASALLDHDPHGAPSEAVSAVSEVLSACRHGAGHGV